MLHKKSDKEKLKKINELFNGLDTLLSSLSLEAQGEIAASHGEHFTLQHCIRWGLQASKEMIEETESEIELENTKDSFDMSRDYDFYDESLFNSKGSE